jgi:hypothetical protein
MILRNSPLAFDEAAHRYYLNGRPLPSVTQVLGDLLNYGFLDEQDRARYLERGRLVHAATADDDAGVLDETTVPLDIRGYVLGWRAFRADYDFRPDRIEQQVCNEKFGYAGTLDRTGVLRGGGLAIIDIKSGAMPASAPYQLAAYAGALPAPRRFRRLCVELHADAGYRVIGFATRDYQHDFDTFLAALETFKTKEEK